MTAVAGADRGPDRAALAALAFLTLVWGYNWVVMKLALAYTAPLSFAAWRGLGGGLCLLAVPLMLRKPCRPPNLSRTLLLGLLQTTLFAGLISLALVQGGAGKSAVLVYAMPFWLILLAPLTLGERIHGLQWLVVALGFAGLLLIFAPWQQAPDLVSCLYALAAGICWALSVVVAKKIKLRDKWQLLALTGWQMALGSLPLLLASFLLPHRATEFNATYWIALIYNIVPGNALAWLLWLFVVARLTAAMSGLGSLATPVVGILAGWLQLGEKPPLLEGVGMLLVLAALGLLALKGQQPVRS